MIHPLNDRPAALARRGLASLAVVVVVCLGIWGCVIAAVLWALR